MRTLAVCLAVLLAASGGASAQTQPTPGPTKPPPTVAQPGQAPTTGGPSAEQCRAGWNPSLVWSKEQVEIRCNQQKGQK
jgi:hypothetical protein